MPQFVVYEVWTRSYVVEAETEEAVYGDDPSGGLEGLSLCNWHAVEVAPIAKAGAARLHGRGRTGNARKTKATSKPSQTARTGA